MILPADVIPDYGDIYFHIGCYWPDPADLSWSIQPAIWRCFEHVETDLITGFLYLELENSNESIFVWRKFNSSERHRNV